MTDLNDKELLEKENSHECDCAGDKSNCENPNECEDSSNEENQGIFITLTTDEGNDLKCQVLGTFDDGIEATYIALMPVGDDTVYLYGFEDHAEEPILRKIESDKEYDRARTLFLELSE